MANDWLARARECQAAGLHYAARFCLRMAGIEILGFRTYYPEDLR